MKTFQSFNESFNIKGLEYERKVHAAMKSAKIKGLDVGSRPGAGFSNQGSGDIEALYNGEEFNIEIKLDKNAQMGYQQYNLICYQLFDSRSQFFYRAADLLSQI